MRRSFPKHKFRFYFVLKLKITIILVKKPRAFKEKEIIRVNTQYALGSFHYVRQGSTITFLL